MAKMRNLNVQIYLMDLIMWEIILRHPSQDVLMTKKKNLSFITNTQGGGRKREMRETAMEETSPESCS